MQRLTGTAKSGSALRGLAWVGGVIATLCAAGVAAILALFAAATVVVIAVMSSALLALAGFALRAKRTVKARKTDPQIIEATRTGGHSWVAYGWNERR